MNAFYELLQYCRDNGHWVTLNYSPFDKSYQVYVNPGRGMTSARRHKELGDAVRACWAALGAKPKTQWVDVKDKTDRKVPWDHCTNVKIPYDNSANDKLVEKIIDAACGVEQPPKRRGRPKGSKNKPKEAV